MRTYVLVINQVVKFPFCRRWELEAGKMRGLRDRRIKTTMGPRTQATPLDP